MDAVYVFVSGVRRRTTQAIRASVRCLSVSPEGSNAAQANRVRRGASLDPRRPSHQLRLLVSREGSASWLDPRRHA